jgi:CRP-like cAMP-binding protein
MADIPATVQGDQCTAFPKLTDDQIEVLTGYGTVQATHVGQVLFRAGDPSHDFVVVLAGEVEFVEEVGDTSRESHGTTDRRRRYRPYARSVAD